VKLIFSDEAWDDYLYWQKQDRKMVERINKLIHEVKWTASTSMAGKTTFILAG